MTGQGTEGSGPSLLNRWREKFEILEKVCPWPGPRPLRTTDDAQLLVGRADDCDEFRKRVDGHRLVFLTGASGVGKSSLLEAGLLPALQGEEAGYIAAVCSDWSGGGENPVPAAFLAAKVEHQFRRRLPGLPTDASLFWKLEDDLGDRCVIVLDQFEELIRDAPAFAEALLSLLVQLNHATNLRLVISLRSEYIHRLERVETGARPFTMSHYRLKPIDPTHARAVVDAGNAGGRAAIDPDAAQLIVALWESAQAASLDHPGAPFGGVVGLLHLQALLYALNDAAGGGTITKDTIVALQRDRTSTAAFLTGLQDSVDVKLKRCRAASRAIGVDSYLVEGTAQALANSVRHLASAGYKLVRGAGELAGATMGAEFQSLLDGIRRAGEDASELPGESHMRSGDGPLDAGQFDALLGVAVKAILPATGVAQLDLLAAERKAVASAADDATPGRLKWADRLHAHADPWVADPAEVTCGPMSGLAPAAVLIEEMRRFVFALAWLRESSLIRISTPAAGEAKVSLIHDGFGEALRLWSLKALDGPRGALHAITAPRGASFGWRFDRSQLPPEELDGGDRPVPKVLANLRWKGAGIRSNFRNVAFVNCDLRGAYFEQCAMTGVTFVNCLLDGVIFSDCTFRGRAGTESGDWHPDALTFTVPVHEPAMVEAFAHYRGLEGHEDYFLSPVPLLPAQPATHGQRGESWTAEPGGVTLYGGRISALVIRSCRFEEEAKFSLRHVAGSGLDVVEQRGGSFELFASGLRHLTFTTAVGGTSTRLTVEASKSSLSQVWIGEGVTGVFRARDCALVHIWNGSADLAFTAEECRYEGLANVSVDDATCKPIIAGDAPRPLSQADPDRDISDRAKNMDYRRNPAVVHRRQTAPTT